MKRTFKEKTWAGLLTCALLLQAAPISALTTDDTSQQDRSPITADSLSDPSEAEGSEEADLDSPEMQSKEEHPTKSDDDQQQTKTELPESNDNALPASLVNWDHKIFGESTDTKNNGVQVNPDGSVTVKSVNGKGKFQSSGSDGLTYYYTQVPKSSNFKLAAKISVDSWKYSNGQ